MKEATFSMVGYKFTNVELDFNKEDNNLTLELKPKGVFFPEQGEYELIFDFYARSKDDIPDQKIITHITCESIFRFTDVHAVENIPTYFYANSIAIIFPYVRAFISTVTLQANVNPIILPTLNLSSLKDELINNTIVK